MEGGGPSGEWSGHRGASTDDGGRHAGHGPWNVQHYYVAVDRYQFKLETLVDLLEVLGRRPALPAAVVCSSRDVLDALISATISSPLFSLSFLHSDQSDAERVAVLTSFQQTVTLWNRFKKGDGADRPPGKPHLLLSTEACLPHHQLGEHPLGCRLLINYDIPTKKEGYHRRLSCCFSQAGGVVVNVVVAGDVSSFRKLEEASQITMVEMPIEISELL